MSEAGRPVVPADAARSSLVAPAPRAVNMNALQAAWLREIGVPKALLPARQQANEGAPHAQQQAAPSAKGVPTARAALATQGQSQTPDERQPQAQAFAQAELQPQTSGFAHAQPHAPALTQAERQSQTPASAQTQPATQAQASTPPRTLNAVDAPISPVKAKPIRPGASSRPTPVLPVKEFVPVARNADDVKQADLNALQPQVQTCAACALSTSRQHAVFGAGPEQAEWMVVGEAPGEQEDAQGLPFVGRSGELLTEMLRAVGVGRDTGVFISNVIKCRPPGNRNPRPEEIEACKPFLLRQIQLIQPKRLLVVGRFAAQVLLGSDANLNALRGRVHIFDDGQGRQIPLVVSYHPAYLLRSPQEKARAWRDLMLAAK